MILINDKSQESQVEIWPRITRREDRNVSVTKSYSARVSSDSMGQR